MRGKRRKPRKPKPRDPTWRMRRALGHKIKRDLTKYDRKRQPQDVVVDACDVRQDEV